MIKVEEETTSRLDTYLAEKLELSRSKIQKLIKEDLVTVNGKNVNGSYQVKLNDEIEVNDVIINEGFNEEKVSLCYHCNFGYPLVREGAKMINVPSDIAEKRSSISKSDTGWLFFFKISARA